jgi:hypothetical protein
MAICTSGFWPDGLVSGAGGTETWAIRGTQSTNDATAAQIDLRIEELLPEMPSGRMDEGEGAKLQGKLTF